MLQRGESRLWFKSRRARGRILIEDIHLPQYMLFLMLADFLFQYLWKQQQQQQKKKNQSIMISHWNWISLVTPCISGHWYWRPNFSQDQICSLTAEQKQDWNNSTQLITVFLVEMYSFRIFLFPWPVFSTHHHSMPGLTGPRWTLADLPLPSCVNTTSRR